jgi:hypothetical protein
MATCGGLGGPTGGCSGMYAMCQYSIYENPQNAEQTKMNLFVNTFCGFQTPTDIINWVNNIEGFHIVYPLIFPPALQYIPAVNSNVVNDRSSRVLNQDEYTLIQNPYWDQAQVIQGLMYGQTQMGSWPCSPTFSVPFNYYITDADAVMIEFADIPNPGYNQCMSAMLKQLETPQPKGNNLVCIDGLGANLASIAYSPDLIQQQIDTNDNSVLQCLTPAQGGSGDPSQCSRVLFKNFNIGPYNVTTNQPCQNINEIGCTYIICNSTTPTGGWNCTSTGRCIQVSAGGSFPSLEACQGCQTAGTCPGSNTCCPQAQSPTYGSCSTSGGSGPSQPPLPSYMKDVYITLGIITALGIAMIAMTVYLKRRK